MTCKTLQGKYAEKLENKIKEVKKCLKKYEHTSVENYIEIMNFYKELKEIIDRRDEYEFLEQKNKK